MKTNQPDQQAEMSERIRTAVEKNPRKMGGDANRHPTFRPR